MMEYLGIKPSLSKELQVFNAVVSLVAVDVMDDFITSQGAAEVFGHDQAVLADVALFVSHAAIRMVERKPEQDIAALDGHSAVLPSATSGTILAAPKA